MVCWKKVTNKNKYSISRIDNLFDQLYGDGHFSNIDIRFSYHQISVKDRAISKIDFKTRYDRYKFAIMFFTNIFSCNMVFNKYVEMFVIVFIRNIQSYSRSEEVHVDHLRVFLQTLKDCQFFF